MRDKVNYIHTRNFINLFHTLGDQKIRQHLETWDCGSSWWDEFSWLHFIYIKPKCISHFYFRSFPNLQYVNGYITWINRYTKKRNIESKAVSYPQSFVLALSKLTLGVSKNLFYFSIWMKYEKSQARSWHTVLEMF